MQGPSFGLSLSLPSCQSFWHFTDLSFPAHSCSLTSWLCACCSPARDKLSTHLHPPLCLLLTPPSGLTVFFRDPFPPPTKLRIPVLSYASPLITHSSFLLLGSVLVSAFPTRWQVLGSHCPSLIFLALYLWCLGHKAWMYGSTIWQLNKLYYLSQWMNEWIATVTITTMGWVLIMCQWVCCIFYTYYATEPSQWSHYYL